MQTKIHDLGPSYGQSTATSGTTYHLHAVPGSSSSLALYVYDLGEGEAIMVRDDLPLSAVDDVDYYADVEDESLRVMMAEL